MKLPSNPMDKPTIRDVRSKEVGTAWYEINGERGTVGAISGGGLGVASGLERGPVPVEEPEESWTQFFQALVIPSGRAPRAGQERRQIPRHTDSEIKIFSYVASRFANQPPRQPSDSFRGNQVFPDVRGSIHLYTNNIICPSCAFVIGQFTRMFPNVEVIPGRAQPHRPRRSRKPAA